MFLHRLLSSLRSPSPASWCAPSDGERFFRWGAIALWVAHCACVTWVLNPWSTAHPLQLADRDYPLHAHRATVARESLFASAGCWGFDPAINGGIMLHPTQDIGSKPYEALAILFPHTDTTRLIAYFTWVTLGFAPAALLVALRLWRRSWEEATWGLLASIAFLWFGLPQRAMWKTGMVAFLSASYCAPLVLVGFARYLERPSWRGWLLATGGGALLFLLHPCGPVGIALPLAALVVAAPRLDWRTRLTAGAAPLVIAGLNWYWLGPVLRGLAAPLPPWRRELRIQHDFYNWNSPRDLVDQLGIGLILLHVVALIAAVLVLWRRSRTDRNLSTIAIALTLASTLGLFFCGSFLGPLRILQPVRFAAMFWSLTMALVGLCVVSLRERWNWPNSISRVAWGATTLALASGLIAFKPRLAESPDVAEVIDFIRRETAPGDRLLLEATGRQFMLGRVIPQLTGREVICGSFPDEADPIQFLDNQLLGAPRQSCTPDTLRESLERWSVQWAFVLSDDWREIFADTFPEPAKRVGPLRVFRIPVEPSRFAAGDGQIIARVNRLELSEVTPSEGRIVLRYRYHPGWTVVDAPCLVEPYEVREACGGWLMIRNPPERLTLEFRHSRPTTQASASRDGARTASRLATERQRLAPLK